MPDYPVYPYLSGAWCWRVAQRRRLPSLLPAVTTPLPIKWTAYFAVTLSGFDPLPTLIPRRSYVFMLFHLFTSNQSTPEKNRIINARPVANPKRNLTSFKILRVFDVAGADLSMTDCQSKLIPATRIIVQVVTKRISVPGVLIIGVFRLAYRPT